MYLKLTSEGGGEFFKQLESVINSEEILEATVFDTAADLENEATENLQERIYGNKESPRYRRTGNARRGRVNEKKDRLERHVRFNSKIGGAAKNYTPFLNRNKRIAKFNTFFWDDAVEYIRKHSKAILQKHFDDRVFKSKIK